MPAYIARRFLYMLLLLVLSSMLSFLIITLPPGDFLSHYLIGVGEQGVFYTEQELDAMREAYGLHRPLPVQYLKWMERLLLKGDMGRSFRASRPVKEMIAERLPMTLVVSFMTLFVTYLVAIPIGIYSAIKQYSIGDYAATFFGFLGASTPDFLIALVLMLYGHRLFGISVGGLYSRISERALELGQNCRRPQTLAGAAHRDRAIRHRVAHPHHARHVARRVAPALCANCPRQGPSRAQITRQIPHSRGGAAHR